MCEKSQRHSGSEDAGRWNDSSRADLATAMMEAPIEFPALPESSPLAAVTSGLRRLVTSVTGGTKPEAVLAPAPAARPPLLNSPSTAAPQTDKSAPQFLAENLQKPVCRQAIADKKTIRESEALKSVVFDVLSVSKVEDERMSRNPPNQYKDWRRSWQNELLTALYPVVLGREIHNRAIERDKGKVISEVREGLVRTFGSGYAKMAKPTFLAS